MAQPNVITYSVGTGNATFIVNAAGATSSPLALNSSNKTTLANGAVVVQIPGFPLQQRVLVTSTGNDSGIFFRILGLNQANNTVQEFLAGSNATFAVSNLDYATILSIQGSSSSTFLIPTATANTVSVGISTTGGTACSLWQIMNWHVAPTNIEISGTIVGSNGATWTAQYTYDDPNNLPTNIFFPQPFNHPTLLTQTGTLDGPINDPVTAVRLMINAGTGTVRFTIIQAGIGSP